MIQKEAIDYIKKQRAAGFSDKQIANVMQSAGWQAESLPEAFRTISQEQAVPEQQLALSNSESTGTSSIISQMFNIYQKRFLTLIGLSIIITILVPVITLIFGLLFGVGSFAVIFTALTSFSSSSLAIGGGLLLLFVLITGFVAVAIGLWGQGAMLIAIHEQASFAASAKRAFKFIIPLLGVAILNFLIISGGFTLFFFPGIIISISITFASYIVIIEGKRGLAAIQQSRQYVNGRWFFAFGSLLLFGIATGAIYGLISLLTWAVNIGWLTDMFGLLYTILFTPLTSIFVYCLYQNLRAKKTTKATVPSKSNVYLIILACIGALAIAAMIIIFVTGISQVTDGLNNDIYSNYNFNLNYNFNSSP
ncbi:MAG: hypothetical protein V1838_03615 [Patescibacteria group bacterium]